MYDLLIKNGRLVSSDKIVKTNLYIQNGQIASVTESVHKAAKTFDASGLYVLPGCVDSHCHFREPGLTHKEDFSHGTAAAIIGGTTTVFDMPNTNPPLVKAEEFTAKAAAFKSKAYSDYAFWGLCLGPINNNDLQGLAAAGAIALKFFWGYGINNKTLQLIGNYKPGMPDCSPPLDDGEVFELFEHASKTNLIFAIHAENIELIQLMTNRVLSSGRRDYSALLEARPNLSEVLTLQTAIAFCKATHVRLHILHLSTAEGVNLVRNAKAQGLPLTAETCPHYLFLTNEDYDQVGQAMKVYPPVRQKKDQQALWAGLKDGSISVISSDHAPHSIAEKNGDLFSVPAGSCSVEVMLPMMLNEVSNGRLTLPFVVDKLSESPAKLYNIFPKKGNLQPGADADIVLVDMNKVTRITNDKLHSKQPLTPFAGKMITGWPVATFLRGIQIVSNGSIIHTAPSGELIKPLK
ncbi:MAG: dihydroorotase family protein [Veillonellales bacterium]